MTLKAFVVSLKGRAVSIPTNENKFCLLQISRNGGGYGTMLRDGDGGQRTDLIMQSL